MTYNIVKSKFYYSKTLVCFLLCVTFLSLIATSCRNKDKSAAPAKCEGYFVSIFNMGNTETRNILCLTNAENNYGFYNAISVSDDYGALNWRNQRYYSFVPYITGVEFRYAKIYDSDETELGTYIFNDTTKHAPLNIDIICNSLSDILYCFTTQSDSTKLYEVSRNGMFNVHLIGVYDTSLNIRTAAVDETTGNIFAMQGNTLKKIDPNNGNASEVATYTDSQPRKLYYNDNDKMIYAVDRVGQYRLLRINPADGVLNVQGIIDGMDSLNFYQIAFDHCNNQLIHLRYQNPPSTFYLDAYWINLKDASIASSLPNIWSGYVLGYINGKFPEKK